MEVTKKDLRVVWGAVTNARNTLCVLAWDDYPNGQFCGDNELERIFYELNDICIKLTDKIDRMDEKEIQISGGE